MKVSDWKDRLRAGLAKSATRLNEGLAQSFQRRRLDSQAFEDLEDSLIAADIGVATAGDLVKDLAREYGDQVAEPEAARRTLATLIAQHLRPVACPLTFDPVLRPAVVLVVGVNGTGKTTTIGKLARRQTDQARKTMIVAGDTFRAAAVEQLRIWGERTGAEVVSGPHGTDAAGLAHDACTQARARGVDTVLIDTAGRLHTNHDLMAELAKIHRALGKALAGAPHEIVLVLDAGAGQNTLAQIEHFKAMLPITGLIVTKLDGTAHGGILVAAARFSLPVYAIGVGEDARDLQDFSPEAFSSALLGLAE